MTLVSRENFSLYTPMLHEVVASDLEPADICNSLRKLLRRVMVLNSEIEAIGSRRPSSDDLIRNQGA